MGALGRRAERGFVVVNPARFGGIFIYTKYTIWLIG